MDICKESWIFTGMRYNVFKSEDRKNLITKAGVKDVEIRNPRLGSQSGKRVIRPKVGIP